MVGILLVIILTCIHVLILHVAVIQTTQFAQRQIQTRRFALIEHIVLKQALQHTHLLKYTNHTTVEWREILQLKDKLMQERNVAPHLSLAGIFIYFFKQTHCIRFVPIV